jgi:hypothetical protein
MRDIESQKRMILFLFEASLPESMIYSDSKLK